MPLDYSPWHIMIRVRRGAPPERTILDAVCEEVYASEDAAAGALASWRADEPLDDLFWLTWTLGTGHRYCGSSVRAIANYGQTGIADRIASVLAPALLDGIRLCVAAMRGEYGDSDVSHIRPSSPPEGGKR